MPRSKSDVVRDIAKIKAGDSGSWSYSGGSCVKCDKTIKEGSEKVVDIYDICWNCYDSNVDASKDRLMSLINELERL